MVIVWNEIAKNELKSAYEYILKDSHQNAIKVRQEIIDAILSLTDQPDKHRADKYKTNNDGTWRAFEIHRYRVSYRVKNNQIRIIRLRHTRRSPQLY
ncbi:type II toxin-antitoxin system RelE/ParE family toxin [Niabella drilacis]|uniref:Plasmid stabilization system protein ParE n=1 Tax=Niabella drilacis (strain DSM 25811 / CCM 8410 / CCUG 62505 / LMG 26954 / E90) TaxID=1285928 RepID=A0A1G6PTI9_NIADE|nr:type II toxin-antitoxin system RelE/ParE family toxin [Niabella drilacis]SDC83540.1 Plasmid stabilization system protein ParE [Niabella drilacis]